MPVSAEMYEEKEGTDILFIGCSCVGKTLLIRQLRRHCDNAGKKTAPADRFLDVATTQTTGMEIDNLLWKRCSLRVKEVGSDMRPMWIRYFADCRSVTFVMDISNPSQAAASVIEFLNILAHPDLDGKPILLVVNKIDAVHTMSPQSFADLVCLDELKSVCSNSISIHRVSALDGTNIPELLDAYVSALS